MMETMEVLGVDPQDEVEAENGGRSNAPEASTDAESGSTPTSAPIPTGRKTAYPAITAGPHPQSSTTVTPTADKGPKKKKGLTPEQKEKLQLIQQEQENIRKERVANLSEKLLQKISVWIETDRSEIVTEAFKTKMQVLILCLSCLTFSSMKQRF
jgi:hypothetical protein